MDFQVKENSFIARVAAWKLRSKEVAVVIGKTIHLHNISREEFLRNKAWLNHELEHIRQYQRYGLVSFLFRYLVESAKRGYYNNKYEVEARAAENKTDL